MVGIRLQNAGAVGVTMEEWGNACQMQALRGERGPCHWCDTKVFFSVSPRPPLPPRGTGSGRKWGAQPPTPVLCTSLGVTASVLGGGTGLKPRAGFFFGGGGVGCLSPSLSLSLCPSPSLSVCLSFCALSASVSFSFVSGRRVYHLFLGGWVFPLRIVPAAPRGPCGWCNKRFFFFRVPTPTTAISGAGSGTKRNGGDMLAKCRRGLDYGWYAKCRRVGVFWRICLQKCRCCGVTWWFWSKEV